LSKVIQKFDQLADGYREHDYADPVGYFERRAQLVAELSPRLRPGHLVLDLACGDGAMAVPLLRRGLRYRGVDASEGMIAAARRRQPDAEFVRALFDDYTPPEHVDATIFMRTIYLVTDRPGLFSRVFAYTRIKFVFDFDPRVQDEQAIVAELYAAGYADVSVRPFLLPQRHRLPRPVQRSLYVVEPFAVARLLMRAGLPRRLLVTATP
jgi:SAM-dependent methyltransferase